MINTEPARTRKKNPEEDHEIEHLGKIQNSESQPSNGADLIFRIAVVAIATIITQLNITQATDVTAPTIRRIPKTNSTVETNTALKSGNGTFASTNVSRICSRRSGTKSLPRPERKKSKPTATRATRIPSHCHACNSLRNVRTQNISLIRWTLRSFIPFNNRFAAE